MATFMVVVKGSHGKVSRLGIRVSELMLMAGIKE